LQPSLALAIQVLPKYKTENEKNYPADPSDHTNKSYSNNRFPLTSLKETEEDLEYIDIEEGEEQVKNFLKSVFLGGIVFGLFLWCEKDEDPNKQCFKN
jgi:hypothetical protein